jgi:hypothetical protein
MPYPSFDDRFQAVSDQFDALRRKTEPDFDALQAELAVECAVLLRRLRRSCRVILATSSELLERATERGDLPGEDEMWRLVRERRESDPTFAKQIAHLGPDLKIVNRNAMRMKVLDYLTEDEQDVPESERESLYDLVEFVTAYYFVAARLLKAMRQLPGLSGVRSAPVRDVRNKLLEHPDGRDSQVMLNSFGVSENEGPIVKAVRREGQADVFPDKGLVPNTMALLDDLASALSAGDQDRGKQSVN